MYSRLVVEVFLLRLLVVVVVVVAGVAGAGLKYKRLSVSVR